MFGMVIARRRTADQPDRPSCTSTTARSRPIDAPLAVRGRVTSAEGRKAFVSAELRRRRDGDLLAEANGLMVRLLPGQP